MSGDWDLDTDWSNNGYQSGPARVANTVSVFSGLYNRLEQSVTSRQLTLKQYVLASLSLYSSLSNTDPIPAYYPRRAELLD